MADRDQVEYATELPELKATAATYANQIQALALRNAELEDEAGRLRNHSTTPAPTSSTCPRQRSALPAAARRRPVIRVSDGHRSAGPNPVGHKTIPVMPPECW
jgi:hypothetical protein